MKNFLESKKTRAVIFTLGGIAGALLIFGGGVAVGYQKAIFSSSEGMNYQHNFGMGLQRGPNAHGVMGDVIDVASSSFSVTDSDNDEHSIVITSDTVIRDVDQTVSVSEIAPGSRVVVIGAPNADGQVEARFVRVFPN
jgi:hypothetical protein